ncbi:MAG TPA: flagellar biosynthesis protein FlhB [Thermodesulfobacteriota bacterium]|nr:flagellar biosynthesis protein FlhB [Thermodesulfobacteriota bacterium]
MAEQEQDKTEQPTSRRREQARQDGNFAVSKEVSTLFVIMGGLVVLYFCGLWIVTGASDFMRESFSRTFGGELTVKDLSGLFSHITFKFFLVMAPVLLIPVFGAASYIFQNGFSLSEKPITPDFKKINPISGAKKLFSLNSVAELVKSVLKVGILGYVVYVNVAREWTTMPHLIEMETVSSLSYIARVSVTIMTKTVWVLVLIALIDYVYQRWNFEKGLRMTKEEVREEMKDTEGDPNVKARIKSIQRELARKRMMQDVPTADVVVTNPTHLAVALKYDKAKADAPIVVAKGADLIAEKIREIAKKHRVPLVENKPLARTLFKSVEVGKEVPVSLYKAVAEVLAYVYRLRSKVRAN